MTDRHESYRDRKLDLALTESLGGETPPDLSEQILAENDEADAPAQLRKPTDARLRRRRWLTAAVAVSLLLALAGFVVNARWSNAPIAQPARLIAGADRPEKTVTVEELEHDRASTLVTVRRGATDERYGSHDGRGDGEGTSLLSEFEKEHGGADFIREIEGQKRVQTDILQPDPARQPLRYDTAQTEGPGGVSAALADATARLDPEALETSRDFKVGGEMPLLTEPDTATGTRRAQDANRPGPTVSRSETETGKTLDENHRPYRAVAGNHRQGTPGRPQDDTAAGSGDESSQLAAGGDRPVTPADTGRGEGRGPGRLGNGQSPSEINLEWSEQRNRETSEHLASQERRSGDRIESDQPEPMEPMESTQRNLAASKNEVADLRGRMGSVPTDRDEQLSRGVTPTDQVRQARTGRGELEERRNQPESELARRKETGLDDLFADKQRTRPTETGSLRGLPGNKQSGGTPPSVGGTVTGVSTRGFVEISLGTDDGIRDGQSLDIFTDNSYLGRVVIRRTGPDRAVGQIIPEYKRGDIRRGDRVTAALPLSKIPPKKTWRRAAAAPNATRLVIGDRDELPPQGVQANVVVDGFRARVLLDWYYYNDRGRRLEGNFKLRLPNDASLYYLAFGQTSFEYRPQADQLASVGFLPAELLRSSGTGPKQILDLRRSSWDKVKEARVVPRQKAAYAYSETVRRRVDPALAEWSGAGVFQCRVFPLESGKLHRIVVGYDVNLVRDGEYLAYNFDLPEGVPECTVDMNVAALPGTQAEISPHVRPFTGGGRAYYHFEQPAGEKISLRLSAPETVLLTGRDDSAGAFFATQVRPHLPAGKEKAGSSHAVFLVDTSLSSRPEKFNTYLDLLKEILDSNRGSLELFAVLFFNIESHWWKDGYTKNTPENVARLVEHCHTLALEGATDLKQSLTEAARPAWHKGRAGEALHPDLFLLSDGAITWGEDNLHLMAKTLAANAVGPLFAYKTGQSGTASGVLEHLARETGGAVFSIASQQEIAAAATAHGRRPWLLLDVSMDGGEDLMVAGRPRTIYPGQQLTIAGRGTPEPLADMVLKVKRGDQVRAVRVPLKNIVASELAPRAYGQIAVGQLEDLMPATDEMSIAYARYFRVAGRSCSLLMLDSEADYQRFKIRPEDDKFVVRSSPAAEVVVRVLDETAARRTDPKAAVIDWLDRLQRTQGFELKTSTATKLAIEKMPARVFEVDMPRLNCRVRSRDDLPKQFTETLGAATLDYDAVTAESERRLAAHTTADALKAVSSLVENNPGDMVLLRDVAFSAMKWGFNGQSYPLLRRVAMARPYQPQVYTAMGRCLAGTGHADLAIIYFEVALGGQWANRYPDFSKIARMEYLHLLQRIEAGELETSVPDFARARLDSLRQGSPASGYDLVVIMEWNTDRTDVDMHVVEPSGEECSYNHKTTRSGGRITDDVTEGFGPEMYTLAKAPVGKYRIKVNYFGDDQNRTSARTKVYLSVYRDFGSKNAQVQRHAVTLSHTKEKREVATVGVE